ncbi:MAG: polysaccharide deacetylase family protein [Actinobacteria bacterium]|nr:polysaccharide deacetylase family protein [Actinomycetota bacterium]
MRGERLQNAPLRAAAAVAGLLVLVSAASAAHRSGASENRVGGVLQVSALPLKIGRELANSNALYLTRTAEVRELRDLARLGVPLYCGGRRRYAALTFDDGPTPTTGRLLRMLRRAGVPATFFAIGKRAQAQPSALRALGRGGAIGNHTWSHPQINLLTPPAITRELRSADRMYAAALGRHIRSYDMMRPPYGEHNAATDRVVRKLGYAQILWSADSQDALGQPWKVVSRNVVDGLGPGSVILMHDGPAATFTALRRRILPAIRRSRLTMVTVPELLVLNPPGERRLLNGPRGCRHAGKVNVSGYFEHAQRQR